MPGRMRETTISTLLIVLTAVMFGQLPMFAKNLVDAGLDPAVIALYRYALAGLVLLPFLRVRGEEGVATAWGMTCGAAMGFGWIGYVIALDNLPVATLGVLHMTYPLFTLAIGALAFGSRIGVRAMLGGCLILGGAIVALGMRVAALPPPEIILLALAAPVSLGFSINVLTRKLVVLPPVSRLSSVALGSTVGLIPMAVLAEPAARYPADAAGWLQIAGIALVAALVPQLIYSWHAPRIGAARSSMAGSVELPTTFAVGWVVFVEPVLWTQIVAGLMIIVAIVMTPGGRDVPAPVRSAAA